MPYSDQTSQSTSTTPGFQPEQVNKPETVSETPPITSSENAPLTQSTSPIEQPGETGQAPSLPR